MIPPPLIDWAVWSKLDRYRDIELILLKGHLLLEVMLSEVLRKRLSLTDPQIRKLSFRQKINELAILAEDDHGLMEALDFLAGLNRLRNRLAHDPFPTINTDLAAWSEQVLHVFLKNKHQKFTARTKITQAMSALAGWVYEFAVCETKDSARSCTPILGE